MSVPTPQTHTPLTQVSPPPALHVLPHAPQLLLSVFLLTHEVTVPTVQMSGSDPGHEHVPAVQTPPTSHFVPQTPQFAGSLLLFVHEPLHRSGFVPPQLGAHAPARHTGLGAAHWTPHDPQDVAADRLSGQPAPVLAQSS